MLRAITITRANSRRGDPVVLDVLEELAATKYGSSVNAAIRLIQQSPEYAEALKAIEARRLSGSKRKAC